MAKIEQGHYHCVECGSLFEAPVVAYQEQRCPVCGNPPSGKVLAGTQLDRAAVSGATQNLQASTLAPELHGVSQDARDISEATIEAQGKGKRGRVKRKKRKGKKRRKIYTFLGVWALLMVATVLLVKHFSADEEDTVEDLQAVEDRENKIKAYEAQKKRMVLQAAVPECEAVLTSFLNAPSAAAKAQYVYQGAKLSGVMSRHYRNNPSFSSTRSNVRVVWSDTLGFGGKKVIGTVCRNSLGEKFEAVFVNTGSEWKLDWLSLVRHDAKPWALFQAGADGNEGEFRLYMRVRDSNNNLDQQEMSVVFYKPSMYVKTEFTGLASSPVPVKSGSPLGMKIKEMLASEGEEKRDARGLPTGEFDPPGFHRVRVRLKLHKKGSAPSSFELLEIISADWYGIEQAETGRGLGLAQ